MPIDSLESISMRTGIRGSTWNSFRSSFSKRKIGSPIHGAEIVAVMKVAVIKELLAGPEKRDAFRPPTSPGNDFCQCSGQPFELFQKLLVDQELLRHTSSAIGELHCWTLTRRRRSRCK